MWDQCVIALTQKNFIQKLGGAYSVENVPESSSQGNFLVEHFYLLNRENWSLLWTKKKKKDHIGRARGQRILETLIFEECQTEIKGLYYKAFPTPLASKIWEMELLFNIPTLNPKSLAVPGLSRVVVHGVMDGAVHVLGIHLHQKLGLARPTGSSKSGLVWEFRLLS